MLQLAFTNQDHGNQFCRVHCALCPCVGGGPYRFPATQTIVTIKNNGIVLHGTSTRTECCPYGCLATIISGSSEIVTINGTPIARDRGRTIGSHAQLPMIVVSQTIVSTQ